MHVEGLKSGHYVPETTYKIINNFQGSANGQFSFAEKDGKKFFVKAFIKPKYLPALIFSDVVMDEYIDGYTLITGIEFYPRDGLALRFSNSGLLYNSFELGSLAFGFQFNIKNWTIALASRNLISVGFINGFTLHKRF